MLDAFPRKEWHGHLHILRSACESCEPLIATTSQIEDGVHEFQLHREALRNFIRFPADDRSQVSRRHFGAMFLLGERSERRV
jgi:hypothetical protein